MVIYLFNIILFYLIHKSLLRLLGARNVRASLSPFHAEMEAVFWAMEYMKNLRQFQVTFAMDCSQLVKMVSEPEEWPTFANYLEDVKTLKEMFTRSEIIYIARTQNTIADRLARSVRQHPPFVVHMDADHQFSLQSQYESVKVDHKKKNSYSSF